MELQPPGLVETVAMWVLMLWERRRAQKLALLSEIIADRHKSIYMHSDFVLTERFAPD